jgi:TM2 domain-containing membrane protein YozV
VELVPINSTFVTLFLGGIGAHKFYLRKYSEGVCYFLFFWTLIPGLIAFIEFIVYAFTSSERLREKYPRGGSPLAMATGVVSGFVLIAGTLAAIAIPQFMASRNHSYNKRAIADLRTAIWVQEEFHSDYKTYADSIDKLTGDTYGFIISKGVDLTVQFADAERHVMTASHEDGNKIFKVQGPGEEITEERKAED